MTDLREYAAKLVEQHGTQLGNPSWDIIAESWEGDVELTDDQVDEVYRLWAGARVAVVLPAITITAVTEDDFRFVLEKAEVWQEGPGYTSDDGDRLADLIAAIRAELDAQA